MFCEPYFFVVVSVLTTVAKDSTSMATTSVVVQWLTPPRRQLPLSVTPCSCRLLSGSILSCVARASRIDSDLFPACTMTSAEATPSLP